MFFDSWENLGRILVTTTCVYFGLIFMLRISGNRTLSKMNSFDFVVTIAMGSMLSSGILQKNVPIADTLLGFALLIGFQYLVTWLSVRSKTVDRLVKSEPTMVYFQGRYLNSAMKKSRVNEDEIISAIRQQGFNSPEQVDAVVLESNGSLSVIGKIGETVATVDPKVKDQFELRRPAEFI